MKDISFLLLEQRREYYNLTTQWSHSMISCCKRFRIPPSAFGFLPTQLDSNLRMKMSLSFYLSFLLTLPSLPRVI